MENKLAKHTLFTTLFAFWITGLGAGLIFPTTPGDIAVILVVGSFLFPNPSGRRLAGLTRVRLIDYGLACEP